MRDKVNAVIFDFDGVLADSFPALYRVNAMAFRQIGLAFSEAEYRALFEGNVHKGLSLLVRDRSKQREFAEFKVDHFWSYYRAVKLFPFARKLIRSLVQRFPLSIVSSTQSEFVCKILKRSNLERPFKAILGSTAKSKEQELREAMFRMASSPGTTVFVTDTSGDIRVGRRLGIETVAVGWGFHSADHLRGTKPERVVDSYTDLLEYLRRRGKN